MVTTAREWWIWSRLDHIGAWIPEHSDAAIAILAASLLISAALARQFKRGSVARRRTWTLHRGATLQNKHDLRDPLAQIDAVSRCAFERAPLLNREEARLLPLLEATVRDAGDGHRLMAQTSLGELIRPSGTQGTAADRRRGFAAINSKRLDFAIIDRFGYLVLAIEYQGSGHYQTESFMRDAVKREALRKAGVAMFEIPTRFDPDTIRASVTEALAPWTTNRGEPAPVLPRTAAAPGSRRHRP